MTGCEGPWLSRNWLSARRVNGESDRGRESSRRTRAREVSSTHDNGSHIRKDLSRLVYRSQTRQNRGAELLVRLWRDLWRSQRQRDTRKRARVTRRRTIASTTETVDQKQRVRLSKRVIPCRIFQLSSSPTRTTQFSWRSMDELSNISPYDSE